MLCLQVEMAREVCGSNCKFDIRIYCHLPIQVEVDLGMNAAANARARHEVRKKAVVKQRKTVEANAKALAAAEQKTASTLAQVTTRVMSNTDPVWLTQWG